MDVDSSSWLDGKKILLTGATGYLGKVICEKLLRECLGISKLYILVRSQENANFDERIVRFKNDAIFDRVKSIDRRLMDKVMPIEGDLSKFNLNLQDMDINLLRMEINVVMHCGSNSDVNLSLKDAIFTNVRGTRYLLQLAESIIGLESFVYVSHIFSNCYERIIEEKIFPPRYDADGLVKIMELDKDIPMKSEILKDFSSYYLFSQHLAESLVARSSLQTAVVRIPTLTPSVDEPYPGWFNSSNLLENFMVSAANGSIQSVYGKPETPIDILPVDLAANGIITVTMKRRIIPETGCQVYNLTNGGTGEISWETLMNTNRKIAIENPLETTYWSPGATIYSSYYLYIATFILTQIIPAILYDAASFLCTGKVQYVKNQIELFHQLQSLERFFHTVWMFDTENADELFNTMTFKEKKKFKFQTQNFNLDEYMRTWNNGRRAYLLELDQKASRVAKWKLQAYSVIGVILKTIFIVYVGNEILKYFGCEEYLGMRSSGSACLRLFNTFQKV
ncbi:putative fatty acyl-CoA reductase CG8306 [Episyrphus balteatus]|uniref:putative fatty acyl-CoA reductase CG8306 n=1 Tax=Episyrphus balteatus TaxID=286459 RepID=UPI002484F9DC|nr:putative fatty acyl-CoA reductase CG8306 [Episyrphus balteatus]